jgi:hypothetical protein
MEIGDLLMNKPNFKEMSLQELRKYVLAHRNDEEAWDEFASRPRPNSVLVTADTPLEEQEAIIKKLIERNKGSQKA